MGADQRQICKVCNEPNTKRAPNERGVSKRTSAVLDNADLGMSWSALGVALDEATQKSLLEPCVENKVMDGQGNSTKKAPGTGLKKQFSHRRGSCAESWLCGHCTYRNLDGVAAFCSVCGKSRF